MKSNDQPAVSEPPFQDEEARYHRKHFLSWTIGVIIFGMSYVLSIGPVMSLLGYYSAINGWVWEVYAPLLWLGDQSPFFLGLLDHYLELWGVHITWAVPF